MVHRLGEVSAGEFWFEQDDVAMSQKMAKVAHFIEYSQSLGLVARTATPLGPYEFDVLLGEQAYIDSSMQYRNGTVNLTIKRKPREATDGATGGSR